jgi:hypothetical protein
VQPKNDVINVFGDPHIDPIPYEKRKKHYGADGHILTPKEVEQKKDYFK